MKIIAFTGEIGNGKSTAAERLSSFYLPAEVRELGFADPLKRACLAVFGGELKNYYGTQAEKAEPTKFWEEALGPNYSTYRKIMQTFGTEVMRNHVDKNIWIHSMGRSLERAREEGKELVIITDLRYDNEATFVRQQGGAIIECINLSLPTKVETDTHSSEQGILPELIDMQLAAKSLDELYAGVETIVHAYG